MPWRNCHDVGDPAAGDGAAATTMSPPTMSPPTMSEAERYQAPDLEVTVYRIVQEALTNAWRHGSPSAVQVRVHEQDGTLTVLVTDDGHGFDPGRRPRGVGLVGMRERAPAGPAAGQRAAAR